MYQVPPDDAVKLIQLLPGGAAVTACLVVLWIMLKSQEREREANRAALQRQADTFQAVVNQLSTDFKSVVESWRSDHRQDTQSLAIAMKDVTDTNRRIEMATNTLCSELKRTPVSQ